MNRKFYYSQKIYLFFIYGLLVTMLLSLFFICFYSFYSKNIYKDAKTKSETLCASVHKSVSTELNNMSTISMNIVYSNAIKKNFMSFAKNNDNDEIKISDFVSSRENVLAIYDIITAIIGPFQSASQVNLYTLNGTCIGSGYFQGITYINLQSIPWYKSTIEKNGAKNISTTTNSLNVPAKAENIVGGYFIDINDKENVLMSYQKIDSYNWTIVTSEPKDVVFRSLYAFKEGFVIIIVVSIFSTLLLCFIISSRLTYPLSKLTKATKKVTISRVLNENKTILTSANSNIREISELCQSFIEMYDKLKDSSHEILLLKSEETRAKLQATQSLVNPHFLYNNLTNISIMAEENMNEDIIKICHALCDYFRYITTNDETAVPLFQEILYTEKYIECMKMRYGEDFIYHSNIEESTKNILIPKLIVQPIVENAFKYGFSSSPPWHLKILSEIDNEKWLIHIEDNGGCLSDINKEKLLSYFNDININEEFKTLKIGGMGLRNVYLRLHLLYNEHAIFKIDNSKIGKTIFTIGGPIYLEKEEFYEQYTQI